ncbi:hypothetical protein Tco_0162800 [Tanacetum coccineum]
MDKFKTGLGYNAVPPPYTRNFMPLKSDLVYPSLDDFVDVNESVSEPIVEKPTVETNEPKTTRKQNGAPIIEEWVSNSDEENVPKVKTIEMFNKPSFTNINVVKFTEQVKSPRKTPVDKNRQNTPIPRGNKRIWNQQMSQKLGSNFEMFNKACHVCGSFDHLKNDCNNWSGPISLNTARPGCLEWNEKAAKDEIRSGIGVNAGDSKLMLVIQRSGPNWLFDIDALTNSMNYKPDVAKNQSNGNAGTKACNDAGKARMETVHGKDYILLPMEEEKKDTKDLGNEDSKVPKANAVDPKSRIELLDDPNMPELEDIVYSDDDEDVGAEVDMNNLDACMSISPIPTTRIHKDHLVEQIIVDLHSTPQTRRMTKNLEEHDGGQEMLFFYGQIKEESYVCQHQDLKDPDFPDRERKDKIDKTMFFRRVNSDILTAIKVKGQDGIFISQDKYVTEILKKFGFTDVKTASTPMETHKPLLKIVVVNSTTEAEYIAASNCCGQIHIDNESTICIVKNPVFHSKTKHIEISHHFVRDPNKKKLIQMIKIRMDQNVTDLLTKAFDVSRFQYLIASIGMFNL